MCVNLFASQPHHLFERASSVETVPNWMCFYYTTCGTHQSSGVFWFPVDNFHVLKPETEDATTINSRPVLNHDSRRVGLILINSSNTLNRELEVKGACSFRSNLFWWGRV